MLFTFLLISTFSFVGQICAQEKDEAQLKKEGKSRFGGQGDFDLLLGTKQRDLVQAATHDTLYISTFYKSGPYLIFDCEKGNYACVHKDGYQFCKDLRKSSIDKRHRVLACAPLKKFDRFQFCIERQKELVDFPIEKYFCMAQGMVGEIFQIDER